MILLDTCVLARVLEPGCLHHQPAVDAIALLHNRNELLAICAQNIVELYAIATRGSNSLGMSPAEARTEIAAIKARFQMLPDAPLHAKWEELIIKYSFTGKRVFDLRLVAAAAVGGCASILTFNDLDFASISEAGIINPFELLGIPGSDFPRSGIRKLF